LNDSDMLRFWENVDKKSPSDCWNWTGAKSRGYGEIVINGNSYKAHRLSYLIEHGQDPLDLCICHHCDNPSCVNPGHLFMGTQKQNVQDCKSKGRLNRPSGDNHRSRTHPWTIPRGLDHWRKKYPWKNAKGEDVKTSKLTESQVIEIRERYSCGNITQEQLAKEYGVTHRAIGKAIKKETWKHI